MFKCIVPSAVILVLMTHVVTAGSFEDGLAAYRQGDFATALSLWRPLAEQGDAAAQHNLGVMNYEGQGLSQDSAEAVRWWLMAAEQGFVEAQYSLGVMYEFGRGVAQNKAAAATWFRSAAEQESAAAQYRLGLLYLNGLGVSQDFVMAHMWLNLAAAQGVSEASQERDTLADRMTSEQLAEAQRLVREWKQEPTEPDAGGEQAPAQQQEPEQGGAEAWRAPSQTNVTVLVLNSLNDDGDYRFVPHLVRPAVKHDCCKNARRFATRQQQESRTRSESTTNEAKRSHRLRPKWLPPIDPWYARH